MFNLRLPLVESSDMGFGLRRLKNAGSGCSAARIRIACSLACHADKRRGSRLCDVPKRIRGQFFGIEPVRSRPHRRDRGQNAIDSIPRVIVQRSWNNADPELDQVRRDIVVRVLTDLGNQDANQRVVVSQPYSNGINSMEGEQDYGRFRRIRGFGNGGNNGGGGGGGGGF
jgi:hypothetical protein